MRVNDLEIVNFKVECLEVAEDITRSLRDEFMAGLPGDEQQAYTHYFTKERMMRASEEGFLSMIQPSGTVSRFTNGYGIDVDYQEEERTIRNRSQSAGRCITALLFSDERVGRKEWPALSESNKYNGLTPVEFQQVVCNQYAQEMIEVTRLALTPELIRQLGSVTLKTQD